MIVWWTIEGSCPICSYRLRLRQVGGARALGQDSDLFVRMEGKHVIQAEIHTCRSCHFSGDPEDFMLPYSDEHRQRFLERVSPHLVDRGAGEDALTSSEPDGALDSPPRAAPRLPARRSGEFEQTPLPDLQYYWAFQSAAALGGSLLVQGKYLVRAYWCLRIPPTAALTPTVLARRKRAYLNLAIDKLRPALKQSQDGNLVYLLAELCRRNRQFLLAISYFRRFLETPGGAQYLKTAAECLLKAAHQQQASDTTIEELLDGDAPDGATPSPKDGDGTAA